MLKGHCSVLAQPSQTTGKALSADRPSTGPSLSLAFAKRSAKSSAQSSVFGKSQWSSG